jgi:hypothetical protein
MHKSHTHTHTSHAPLSTSLLPHISLSCNFPAFLQKTTFFSLHIPPLLHLQLFNHHRLLFVSESAWSCSPPSHLVQTLNNTPIPKRYRQERHYSFRRPACSQIESGRGKSHCTRWMQTAENKLISPAQISSEPKSSSSAAHSMTTTGKTNSKN